MAAAIVMKFRRLVCSKRIDNVRDIIDAVLAADNYDVACAQAQFPASNIIADVLQIIKKDDISESEHDLVRNFIDTNIYQLLTTSTNYGIVRVQEICKDAARRIGQYSGARTKSVNS